MEDVYDLLLRLDAMDEFDGQARSEAAARLDLGEAGAEIAKENRARDLVAAMATVVLAAKGQLPAGSLALRKAVTDALGDFLAVRAVIDELAEESLAAVRD